jgi:hypothetical protein
MKIAAFQYAHTLGWVRQLQSFGALALFRVRQSVDTFHPGYLFCPKKVNMVLQPGTSGGEPTLIAKLQHSILGSWLAATQVGFAPTCLQTISSTHVQCLVIRRDLSAS